MRHRWIMGLVLSIAMSALWVGVAFADNTPHGGTYGATTDACAGCHRAHTAVGDGLLKASSTYALCTSCHNGTGAMTDVLDGVLMTAIGGSHSTSPLRGGGFTNVLMNTTMAASPPGSGAGVSSAHKVNGMGGYTADTAWGLGSSGAGSSVTLECSSCHDPHGKASTTNTATYRILRGNLSTKVSGAAAAANVTDVGATKKYAVNDANDKYYGQNYPDADDASATDNTKMSALNSWCAGCHTRIHATGTGTGSSTSGDSAFAYRHRTDGTNISSSDASGAPGCLTCHVAHGTSAAMGTYSAAVPKPGGTEGSAPYLDSSLLRIDNRGVCQACHQK